VADVVAVLDALDIAKALFWGDSMGGWIGFGIPKYAKERVHALVIGGNIRMPAEWGLSGGWFKGG
jgi:pimeloyl-ACP methyl ester carboxylesterase